MTPGEVRLPLRPGESAPQFAVPRADQEGAVCLDDFHGRPLLLTLMRGFIARSADETSPCSAESRRRSRASV